MRRVLKAWRGRMAFCSFLGGVVFLVGGTACAVFFFIPISMLAEFFDAADDILLFALFCYASWMAFFLLLMKFSHSWIEEQIKLAFDHNEFLCHQYSNTRRGRSGGVCFYVFILLFLLWPMTFLKAFERFHKMFVYLSVDIQGREERVRDIMFPARRVELSELGIFTQEEFDQEIQPLIDLRVCEFYGEKSPAICVYRPFRRFCEEHVLGVE